MKKRLAAALFFPWHCFLVAWLPFLEFHRKNYLILGPRDGWQLLLIYWLVVLALLGAGRLAWKSWSSAGLVVTPLVAVLAEGQAMGGMASLFFLVLALAVAVLLTRRPGEWNRLSLPLNLAVLVLVLFPLARLLPARAGDPSPAYGTRFLRNPDVPPVAGESVPPDVYFLLVDGLGQPEYLERAFGLPAYMLTGGLERQGFRILARSRSNYPQTALSLSATLNMAPIPELLEIRDPGEKDRRPLAGLIRDSRVGRAFTGLGYETVTFPSGYPLTRLGGPVHRHVPFWHPSFAAYYVLADGFLPLLQPLLGHGPADFSFALRRGRLEYIFDHLADARQGIDDRTPVFVFAHILAPHPPFVFDSEGKAQTSRARFTFGDGNHWRMVHDPAGISYRRLWVSQAVYVVKRLEEAVERILAESPRPPIIIIQGDHGPGSGTNWDSVGGTDHTERFSIFNAWYVPDDLDIPLRDDQTSINTFPLLLDAVFGAELPLGENRHWFARMREPYRFFEIREQP